MLPYFLLLFAGIFILNGGITTDPSKILRSFVFGAFVSFVVIASYRVADSYGIIPARVRAIVTSTLQELSQEGHSFIDKLKSSQ